jgi:hypothetical protein
METKKENKFVSQNLNVSKNAHFKKPPNVKALPLKLDDQKVFLVNFCHTHHNPRSMNAGIRILGAFSSTEEAHQYQNQYYDNTDINIFCIQSHMLVPICSSVVLQLDKKKSQLLVSELLDIHQQLKKEQDLHFKDNIQNKTCGKFGESVDCKMETMTKNQALNPSFKKTQQAYARNIQKSNNKSLQINKRLNQNYSVIIIFQDIRPSVISADIVAEPMCAILFTSNTIGECEDYIKYTAREVYSDCNFNIIDTHSQKIFD